MLKFHCNNRLLWLKKRFKTLVCRDSHPIGQFLNFNGKTTCPLLKKGTRSPVSHISWILIVCMFWINIFLWCESKNDLCPKLCVVTTTPFSTHFPPAMVRRKGAFTSTVFFYSKPGYAKIKVILELRSFGKSAATILFPPKSSLATWTPKGVSLPQKLQKLRVLGMFLLGSEKPAFTLISSLHLSSSKFLDAPFCSIFYEKYEGSPKSTLLVFLYYLGFVFVSW